VRFVWGSRVLALTGSDAGVTGVRHGAGDDTTDLDSALVVDCSGRGSRANTWLRANGFGELGKSSVYIDVRYVTCNYARPPNDLTGYLVRHYPIHKLGAALLPVENDQWLLSLSGRFGAYAAKDQAGFMASAGELPIAEVQDLLRDRAPTTPVTAYTFAHNEMRHYDALPRVPQGFIASGDSALALNPLYGPGMTSALAQADLLDKALASIADAGESTAGISAAFIPRQAALLIEPWQLATIGDTIYPETTGDLPANIATLRARDEALNTLAVDAAEIARLIFQVSQFSLSPTVLRRPDITARVDALITRSDKHRRCSEPRLTRLPSPRSVPDKTDMDRYATNARPCGEARAKPDDRR
jgi:2-polyprenyl-6-methoxyphenol hydroxylase-like FAD-dependent oxidoreductase